MAQQDHADQCPPDILSEAIATVRADDQRGLEQIELLLKTYSHDARLHFLRGSLLASQQRYGDARQAMQMAIQIAPDYAVARFQLGFLELTSGDAGAAEVTWGPLERLAPDDPLRLFCTGLRHLIRDEFAPAIETLAAGMTLNTENPALNGDMQLIIDKSRELMRGQGEEPTSSAHLLLQQYSAKATRH